jgi:predicted transcriptional regulator
LATLRYAAAMAKSNAISFRFEPELRADLERIAARENRSLSNLIETVLKAFVEADKRKAAGHE